MLERLKRAAALPIAVLLLVYDGLDAVFGPIVRPVIAWLASLALFARIGRWIAALPPYAVLVLLAVPIAVIEPFKFVALYWLAQGRAALGLGALGAAYLASVLICERIFHAGRAQLLRIGWFARGHAIVTGIRDAMLAWIRATAVWRACRRIAAEIRSNVRRLIGA